MESPNKAVLYIALFLISILSPLTGKDKSLTYPIVDTGQKECYNNSRIINSPEYGEAFYGQDAQYPGNPADYTINEDGLTVYDNVTGLTWTQSTDWNDDGNINSDDKFFFSDFLEYVDVLNEQNYGGYNDWRAPTIKELYSLIDFNGTDPMMFFENERNVIPFINTDYFDFEYGNIDSGERIIDAQYWSSTEYVSTTMRGSATTFGVNFADGRIKGYGRERRHGGEMTQYAIYVRGNPDYGVNNFTDNNDGTITDNATALMWTKNDNAAGLNWEDALAWVEEMNEQNYLGYNDWRLPDAKELQSIVDYTRSPLTTNSAAIDPVFNITGITDVAGLDDYPFFWTSTTHVRADGGGSAAAYIAFGLGLGTLDGGRNAIDVHGAGCQRSDPKAGNTNSYPVLGKGPQGDLQCVFNYVRLTRNAG